MSATDLASRSAEHARRERAREFVRWLASGEITEAQMTVLRNWIGASVEHRAAFEAERAVWRALVPLRASLAPARDPAVTHNLRSLTPRHAGWAAAAAALAACLIMLIGAGDIVTRLRADHITAVGEVNQFKLPDGSVAMLNTDSAIAVRFDGSERRIDLLRGEAWFRVRKDATHPFRVHARDGIAEAVGTAFGVRAIDDNVAVSVTEGVVAVSAPEPAGLAETRIVKVSAGLQSFYAHGHGPSSAIAFDAQTVLAWRRRHIVIDDRPLIEAIAELNRYRNGRIILVDRARGDAHVSGVFAVDQLDQGLAGLATTQGLTVTYLTPYLVLLR